MSDPLPDWSTMDLRAAPMRAAPVDAEGVRKRLALTGVATAYAFLAMPSIALFVFIVVGIPLSGLGVGLLMVALGLRAGGTVSQGAREYAALTNDQRIEPWYDLPDRPGLISGVRTVWTDRARWRTFGWLVWSFTGGFVLSLIPFGLLTTWLTWLVVFIVEPQVWLGVMVLLGLPLVVAWWYLTPLLCRLRVMADRAILGPPVERELRERVAQVTESRAETLDRSADEIRRIERDLHDGAQARMVSVGINLGLAQQLLKTDADAAADLLNDAQNTARGALEDLRSVVRSVRPPALADRGLTGAIEALAADLPIPVALRFERVELPEPLESTIYFAVAECLANVVKHASATQAWARIAWDGPRLVAEVGDNGVGGADLRGGTGLAGVVRRLAAFDGTMDVSSPSGGPTVIRMEVPCG